MINTGIRIEDVIFEKFSKKIFQNSEKGGYKELKDFGIKELRYSSKIELNKFYYFNIGWIVEIDKHNTDFFFPVLFYCKSIVCLNPTSLPSNDPAFTMFEFDIISIVSLKVIETVRWQEAIVDSKIDKESFEDIEISNSDFEAKLRLSI